MNLGDSYGGSGLGLSYAGHCKGKNSILPDDLSYMPKVAHSRGKYSKSLLLIPFRFAVEMMSRGWKVRNVIIWHKPNCVPHSVKDRFTVDFEYLFFFVKNDKYYFKQQIEPFKESTLERVKGKVNDNKGKFYQGISKQNYENFQQKVLNGEIKGKNKRAVWNIATSPFRGAHFAVYPQKLIETPIQAGCPQGGLVLDPFMGSGTTAIAAEKFNRNWLGIELNPEYAQMAKERLKNAA